MGDIVERRTVRVRVACTLMLAVATVSSLAPSRTATASVAADERVSVRTDLRRELFRMTNGFRERHDRRAVDLARRICRYATRHSTRMARKGFIFHSTDAQLRDALRGTGWRARGENVGVGSSLDAVQRAFIGSDPHRANILRRAFDHAAVGVVRDDGRVWATVVFYGR
jgi:uncharacterized protein YkwD